MPPRCPTAQRSPIPIFEKSVPGRGAVPCPLRRPGAAHRAAPARRAAPGAAPARGQRAGRGAPLHPALQAQLLGGRRVLPARLLHDEVQPQAGRERGRPPRLPPAPPPPAGGDGAGRAARAVRAQRMLGEITGLPGVSLQPVAGAHGEFTGHPDGPGAAPQAGEAARRCSSPTRPTAPTRPPPRWPATTPSPSSHDRRTGELDLEDFKAKLDDDCARS